MEKRRVLIVEDQAQLRQAVATFLEVLGFEVAGEATDGRDALTMVDALRPDLIIMDMSMPGVSGADATRLLHRDHPTIPVVVLSGHSEMEWVSDALEAGGLGYVLKDSAYEDLPTAIGLALEGRHFVSKQIRGGVQVLRDFLSGTRPPSLANAQPTW